MSDIFIIPESKSDLWDKFILNSSSPNIVNHSIILDNWGAKKFFIKKNQEILAGFSLIKKENKIIKLDENLLYTPIVYRLYKGIPISSIINDKFLIIDALADFLIKENFSGEMRFDHFTTDLRPFLWKNFDYKKKIFEVSDVKYTSLLNISNLQIKDFENSKFFQNMSVRTRQSYRYSIKRKKYIVKELFDKKLIKKLVEITFKRQKKRVDFDLEKHVNILEKLHKKKLLASYICEDDSGNVLSKVIFGLNGNYATFLNGARSGKDFGNDYSMVYLLIYSFNELKNKNIYEVDLEGMNSPKRSFFKNGFGGNLIPYYTIKF